MSFTLALMKLDDKLKCIEHALPPVVRYREVPIVRPMRKPTLSRRSFGK
jgi:hypothetical protein